MKKVFFLGFALFAFAGCMVGPRYSRPELRNPESYAQEAVHTDSITNLKWWEVYQDTVLQGLIKTAIDQNLDLKTALARVEQSKAILGFNKANLAPFIDYSAQARIPGFRDISEQAGLGFPNNSYALLGNVSWEIDLWGRLRHANRAAFADMMASEGDRQSVYISLVAQVAELYFQLRGLDERLDITRHTYEARQEFLQIITYRFEHGEVSELDKLQAEQLAAAAEVQLYSLERGIIAVENALSVLMGRTYAPVARGLANDEQQMPVEIPSGIPSQLLQRRPDIMSAEQQLIAQTERVGVAVALRFPSLSLTGFLGVASPEISTLFEPGAFLGSVTGQLAGPLFRFGQNKRRVEAEQAGARQAAFQYEKAVLSAFAEVENSLAEIRTYQNEYTARSTQVAATEKTLMLSKALYDNGYTSFLQVLDSERELYNSQFEQSVALQNQLIAVVRFYKALGGGW
jgi:outer membrane protein, multidrug efflux system